MAREHLNEQQLQSYYDKAYDLGNIHPTAQRAYGSNTIYSLFTKGGVSPLYERYMKPTVEREGLDPEEHKYETAVTGLVPWHGASLGSPKQPIPYDKEKVQDVLRSGSAYTANFDPRNLHATQSRITSEGVRHYLRHGVAGPLYADQHHMGNQFPFVYIHKDTGVMRLLAGHHRASAALIKGHKLPALYAIGE